MIASGIRRQSPCAVMMMMRRGAISNTSLRLPSVTIRQDALGVACSMRSYSSAKKASVNALTDNRTSRGEANTSIVICPVVLPSSSTLAYQRFLLASRSGHRRKMSTAGGGKNQAPVPPPPSSQEEGDKKKKPTWKDMLKRHGPVFLVYWNGCWLISGLAIYGILEIYGLDPMPIAHALNLGALIDLDQLNPSHGNIAVAIILNEAAELVRFPFVIATVPRVTKWWEANRPAWLAPGKDADGNPKPSWGDLLKKHGPVFVVYWSGLWVLGAAGIFGVLEYHVFGDMDAMTLARSVNLDQIINLDAIPPTAGNLGVAIAFNEILEIVRFPLAIATVPYVTTWWNRIRGNE